MTSTLRGRRGERPQVATMQLPMSMEELRLSVKSSRKKAGSKYKVGDGEIEDEPLMSLGGGRQQSVTAK